MLEWLGEAEKAKRLEGAIAAVIKEGKVRTYDMGGKLDHPGCRPGRGRQALSAGRGHGQDDHRENHPGPHGR